MIKQLAHLCIHSTDLEKTTDFYCNALGLEKGFEFIRDGQAFGYYIKLGNRTFIEVFKGETGVSGNIKHLAIEVDDMDAVLARLKANGSDITEKKLGADHSWQAWVTDPNGVRIEFHEYTKRSLQLHGGICIADW